MSVVGARVRLVDFDIDPRYYRRGPRGELIELSPAACPNGHQLGPGRVQVGGTNHLGQVVRTWLCSECSAMWSRPWLPGAKEWPGVPGRNAPGSWIGDEAT